MSGPNLKTFKLKARGDHGAAKTELLVAFARFCQQLGMTTALVESDHHLIVTTTRAQRVALWEVNRTAEQQTKEAAE
jgi:hypothetical protein